MARLEGAGSLYEITQYGGNANLKIYLFLSLFAATFFFVRYHFILYNYFTKTVLREFFVLTNPEKTLTPNSRVRVKSS
jgi:hypothetical protein